MHTVADVSPIVNDICEKIATIRGVKDVYLWGSYAENSDKPDFVVKDIDIVAVTNFHSGDLLAIDNSRYSALLIHEDELEDEGFNPIAVAFTKKFLTFEKYNVDHWVTSKEGKLLHWGAMPETQDEWAELHAEAENRANSITGNKRKLLHKMADEARGEWRKAYDEYISQFMSKKASGWCPSKHKFKDIEGKIIKC